MRRHCPRCGARLHRTTPLGSGNPQQICPECDDEGLRSDGGTVGDGPPLWKRDEERFVNYRAEYIYRTTDIEKKHARVLAWSELGYCTSGIAERVGHTQGTVDRYLEEVAVQFGMRAVGAKRPEQIAVDASVTPASREDIMALPEATREEWLDLADKYPVIAPDWVDDILNERRDGAGGAR